jgi:hypothetical protein
MVAFHLFQFFCNFAESLLPIDSLPLSFTSSPNPLQGVVKSIRVIMVLNGRSGLDTHGASGYLLFRIRFNFYYLSIFNLYEHSTITVAEHAVGLFYH